MSYLEQVLADYDQTRPDHTHEELTRVVVGLLEKQCGPQTETQREELKAELLTTHYPLLTILTSQYPSLTHD